MTPLNRRSIFKASVALAATVGGREAWSAAKPSTDKLGYRAKIGVLVPATNTVVQHEMDLLAPVGVTNHIARMRPVPRGRETQDMEAYRRSLVVNFDNIYEALASVMTSQPQAVIMDQSLDSFAGGLAGATDMQKKLEEKSDGVPIFLPSFAFLKVFETLGIKKGAKIGAVTPNWPPGDEQMAEFFTGAGYKIGKIIGLRARGAVDIAATSNKMIAEALRDIAAEKVDIILLPGTNMGSLRIAASAADWIGIRTVTANEAVYWQTLRSLGINDRVAGYGELMERF